MKQTMKQYVIMLSELFRDKNTVCNQVVAGYSVKIDILYFDKVSTPPIDSLYKL